MPTVEMNKIKMTVMKDDDNHQFGIIDTHVQNYSNHVKIANHFNTNGEFTGQTILIINYGTKTRKCLGTVKHFI